MHANNSQFYIKRIRALEIEENRLREVIEFLMEALNTHGTHSPDHENCEVCKIISKCGY